MDKQLIRILFLILFVTSVGGQGVLGVEAEANADIDLCIFIHDRAMVTVQGRKRK